jgi:subtilisin family serine protease
VIVFLALIFFAASPSHAFKVEHLLGTSSGGGMDVVGEQVLVHFSTTTSAAQRAAAVTAANGVSLQDVPVPGWALITLSSGASVVPALSALTHFPGVIQVAPNRLVPMAAYPSDPGVASQYSLTNTGAFASWDYGTGSTGKVTIAIIDTGIDGSQPDLQGKIVSVGAIKSQQFLVAGGQVVDDPPTVSFDHGTQVASVAAAITNNGLGIAGVSWGAQLISLKVFDAGNGSTSDLAMANAITYAANTLQNNVNIGKLVVNLSVGGVGPCVGIGGLPLTNTALGTLVTTKLAPIAIAAGNDGGSVQAPANCAGVSAAAGIMPIGATDSNNSVASLSSRGSELNAHGVTAPGIGIMVDTVGGGTTVNSGTSFSSPFVAGLMANMLSYNQNLTPTQIEGYIRAGAYGIGGLSLAPEGNASGAGQVNLFRTMRLTVTGSLAGFDGEVKPIAFPNPFKPSQTGVVTFGIPPSLQGSGVSIKIYTLDGSFVRTVTGLSWNGKNTDGNPVASGTYVFVVTTSAGTGSGRVSVLR